MKNNLLICAAAYVITAFAPLKAQDDLALKTKYEEEAILLDGNQNKYIKNNTKKRIEFFGSEFENEFNSTTEEAKKELKQYRKQRRRGTLLLLAGGTVFIAALAVAPVVTLPVFLGTFGAGIITYDVGAIDLYRSRNHLHKAVWFRNRDLLVKR